MNDVRLTESNRIELARMYIGNLLKELGMGKISTFEWKVKIAETIKDFLDQVKKNEKRNDFKIYGDIL